MSFANQDRLTEDGVAVFLAKSLTHDHISTREEQEGPYKVVLKADYDELLKKFERACELMDRSVVFVPRALGDEIENFLIESEG